MPPKPTPNPFCAQNNSLAYLGHKQGAWVNDIHEVSETPGEGHL